MAHVALRLTARLVDLSRAAHMAHVATAVRIWLFCTHNFLLPFSAVFTKTWLQLKSRSYGESASHHQLVAANFLYCIFPNQVASSVSFAQAES